MGPHVSRPISVIAGPQVTGLELLGFRYHDRAGDPAFEVAVKITCVPPGTVGLLLPPSGAMEIVGV